MIAPELIAARRTFQLSGYLTLADVGMDGDYVTPLQIAAQSPTGPVLLAHHWLDAVSARRHQALLRELGYLPGIPFNKVVDRALALCELTRADTYMTQVFHLLPPEDRTGRVSPASLDRSFERITRHELEGRKVVALGGAAASTCRRNGIEPNQVVDHPSAWGVGRTMEGKAVELVTAIRAVLG